jgi:hypothetical protein
MLNESGRRARSLSTCRTLCGSHLPAILGTIAVVEKAFSWVKVPCDSEFYCSGCAFLAARDRSVKIRQAEVSSIAQTRRSLANNIGIKCSSHPFDKNLAISA